MQKQTLSKLQILAWAIGFMALSLLIYGIIRELFLK
jgi:hypothetical protein